MLVVREVSKNFGGIRALNRVSVDVGSSEIVGLIGPNGSGKTTLFNVISGVLKPDSGSVIFNDFRIDGLPPEKISHIGISRTFQGVRLVEDITVLDNIIISLLPRSHSLDGAFKIIEELCKFVGLKELEIKVRELSEYERRLIEIARALAARPKLVLFDEIMAGLSENEQNAVAKLINEIRSKLGVSVFWIEHVLRAMFRLVDVDKVVVLNWGNKIAEGRPDEILKNPEVVEAYLGEVSWVR